MSNVGQGLVSVAGGIIGFIAGGPVGAAYGFQAGMLVGSALFPTQLPPTFGPRISDTGMGEPQVGGPLEHVWGRTIVERSFKDIVWAGELDEVPTTTEVGGKGGPTQKQTTYTYYQSIALKICRGPILSILRIWENGELVYDSREQQEDESEGAYAERIAASDDYWATLTFHKGTSDQLPDPTIEADKGVGNVPGFRDMAYFVFPSRLMREDQALRHPTFKIELTDTAYVTSRPYPLEVIEALAPDGEIRDSLSVMHTEALDVDGELVSGTLRSSLIGYDDGDPEAIDVDGELISGELRTALIGYEDGEAEALDVDGELVSGELRDALVGYNDGLPEALDVDGELISGTLE